MCTGHWKSHLFSTVQGGHSAQLYQSNLDFVETFFQKLLKVEIFFEQAAQAYSAFRKEDVRFSVYLQVTDNIFMCLTFLGLFTVLIITIGYYLFNSQQKKSIFCVKNIRFIHPRPPKMLMYTNYNIIYGTVVRYPKYFQYNGSCIIFQWLNNSSSLQKKSLLYTVDQS